MLNIMTKKDLDYVVKEGIANSIKVGAGESYLTPYAIALGASSVQVGFLKSIPQLVGSLSQLFSTSITEYMKTRKRMITIGVFFQALMFLPIIYVFFITQQRVWFLILFVMIYWMLGSITVPAWNSWLGDIVPDRIKGKYFGKRNSITKLTSFASMLIAGLLLQFFSNINWMIGFTLIFSVAMISRLVGSWYVHRINEPKYHFPKESKFSFIDFIKRMKKTNYGIFVIYLCLMSFSVQIFSPYSVVYLLKDLKFNYLTYTIVIAASTLSSFLFMPIWGKYIDVFGNKKIITLTGYLIPLVPILWLISKNPFYLMFAEVFSGFAWSGFHLATFNFVFDTVSRSKRVRCVSYYNVLNGVAIFFGASLGGFLLRFGTIFWSKIYLLMIVSGICRFVTSLMMLPRIKEVKWVRRISEGKLLWSLLTTDVLEGLTYPVEVLMDKRRAVKKKGERILEWIEKWIGVLLGKRHKYS